MKNFHLEDLRKLLVVIAYSGFITSVNLTSNIISNNQLDADNIALLYELAIMKENQQK